MDEPTPIAFLTQHGKESLVDPIFRAELGRRVVRVDGLDTDRLGTFTRDVTRRHSQLKTARRKARLAARLGHRDIGLGSEGAFIGDPYTGMLPWNVEVLVYHDRRRRLEVVGRAEGPGQSAHQQVSSWNELLEFAARVEFPRHYLVIRPEHNDHPEIIKGISDHDALRDAYEASLAQSRNGCVFVEVDCRAHCNPTRQAIIREAAVQLAAKLNSLCPQCGTPGFWRQRYIAGLPCQECAAPTRKPRGERRGCLSCDFREELVYARPTQADAEVCDFCNP